MRVAIGTFLIALGAILTFAIGGLGVHIVGAIVTVIGAVWLIIHYHFRNRNRKSQAAYDGRQPRMRVPRTDENAAPPSVKADTGAPATAATRSPLTSTHEVVDTRSVTATHDHDGS